MELQVVDHPEQARYEILVDGELAGFVQYHLRNDVIALIHTETDDQFRGQGLAGRLIRSTLDAARERHLSVLRDQVYVLGVFGDPAPRVRAVGQDRRPEFGL